MIEQRVPRVGVGALILNKDKDVLLMLRRVSPEAGFWSIPGGRVEYQELIEDALKREVKEELGVESIVVALLGITDHVAPEESAHWVSPCYLVEIVQGKPQNLEPEKHSKIEWFSIDNPPEKLAIPAKKAIDFYKRFSKY